MGKQTNKLYNKNQTVLKTGVGGKWEKIGKKKAEKMQERLQTIQEEEGKEDPIITEVAQVDKDIQECGKQAIDNEDSVKNTETIGGDIKILVTKRNTLQLLNNCSRISSILLKDLIVNRKKAMKINGSIAMKLGINIQLPNRLLITSTRTKTEYITKST